MEKKGQLLTPNEHAETNYSQLDIEALAIAYVVTHFFNYISGKRFVLVTDNALMSHISYLNHNLSQITPVP